MVEIPPSLLERLEIRQTVLVAGLRCSELAGAPGWDELAKRLRGWLEDDARETELAALVDAGRRASVLAYLGARVPRATTLEVLKDAYPVRPAAPELVAAAASIPWRGIVTTGFDRLWGEDRAPERAAERFVVNLCGTTATPESLSVGAGEHRARVTPEVLASLRAAARRRSFVLVGFAAGDPDLALVARVLAEAGDGAAPHFLFTDAAGLEAELLGAELGVTIVTSAAGRVGLEETLGALRDAWQSVASGARPAADDVAGWLELARREPTDEEPRAALARAEEALRAERRWDDVVELLLGRVELTESRAEQVAILREVARLYGRELEAADRAFAALEAAFRREPTSEELRVEVERAAGAAGLWGELAADYVELADELGAAGAVPLRLALARVYAEELDQTDDAVAEYEAVLAIDEKNLIASRAVVELLARQGRWAELAVALERAAALEEAPARAVELRLQLADVQGARLGDADAAIATYARVLADDADVPEARDALEKLSRRTERWADLARLLEDKALRASEPAVAARARRERAEILAERLGDADGALAALEAVLARDAGDRAALRAAETLYERQGRDIEALRTVERLAALAESDAERLALLRRLATAWEQRGAASGLDRAADALEQILQLVPDDADAFTALARVYRRARRFLALAEAVARRRGVTGDRAERRALAAELGRIYEEELRDPARAFDVFAEAEAEGDDGEATLSALARLHAQAGRWGPAAEALEKLARTARELATRTDALVRAAAIALEHEGDRGKAEVRYARALELDADDVAALGGLAALYRGNGEILRPAKLMREVEARTTNRVDKARLLYDLGVLYQDELEDEAQATEVLGRVLELDPEHVPAAERLVTLHERAGRWVALEPVLDMLARKADRAEEGAAAAAVLHAKVGETARRLGNLDKAARAFETALALAPESLGVLRGFAALRAERREWREAATLYTAVAARAEALPAAERVALYFELGRCETEAGARVSALGWYDKALALDPGNGPATLAVASLHADLGDHDALVDDKRALLAIATDDETRARLSEEIGDLFAHELGDAAAAVQAYRDVLAHAPTRRQTLHKLLELHTAGKQWAEAAQTLERLAELETAPAVRAKYLYAAAVIRRDELDDPAAAVALLNRALDDAPDMTKAFDAVERVLADVGAWRELARNYRRMIKRLPADGHADLRLRLWSGLGEVSLTQLEDLEMAATALEVAVSLDGDNLRRHEQLADVCVAAGPSHLDKAIAEHQWLV
ncbi:MAG TPA: hypothetical protein VLA14_18035, partial [Polyangia bacterium]|nr:hypothetical protein [Polyangia bacterium]